MLWKCCTQYVSIFGKLAVATGLKKFSFHSNPKKGNDKECSNYHTIALIPYIGKVILKILLARLQQYLNCELPAVQPGFGKVTGTRDPIANICWIIEKARRFQKKKIYFCFIDYAKTFDCVHCNSVTQSCPTLLTSQTTACQASLSISNSQSLLKFMSIESVMSSNHLILCCPLILLPSNFPSIRVFYNDPVDHFWLCGSQQTVENS